MFNVDAWQKSILRAVGNNYSACEKKITKS